MAIVRIDKWLWAARFFKSRTLATEACKNNQIKLNEFVVKASSGLKVNDIVTIKKGPLKLKIKIKDLLIKRVSPSKAKECYEDLTSQDEYEEAKLRRIPLHLSEKHCQRQPTKKQRDLDNFLYENQN